MNFRITEILVKGQIILLLRDDQAPVWLLYERPDRRVQNVYLLGWMTFHAANFIQTFVEYPPSQTPASFTIDQLEKEVEAKINGSAQNFQMSGGFQSRSPSAEASQVHVRRSIGFSSRCIRPMGTIKPDCLSALQRKGPQSWPLRSSRTLSPSPVSARNTQNCWHFHLLSGKCSGVSLQLRLDGGGNWIRTCSPVSR